MLPQLSAKSVPAQYQHLAATPVVTSQMICVFGCREVLVCLTSLDFVKFIQIHIGAPIGQ